MILADVAEYLENQGIGTRATNLFYGILPESPDALVTMYEYAGMANEPKMGQGVTSLEFPRIQLVTRGVKDDYDGPKLVGLNIVTVLAKVANMPISSSGVRYLSISHINGPQFFRRDDNFRILFSINFQVYKDYSTT